MLDGVKHLNLHVPIFVRNVAIAAFAATIGLAFGMILTGSNGTWLITVIGVTTYALVIYANPLAGMLLWLVTTSFSRFMYLDIILGRGIPDLTLIRICTGILLVVVLARLSIGKLSAPRMTLLDGAVLAVLVGIGASLPASVGGLKSALTSFADAYFVPAIVYMLARFLVRERRHAELVCTAFIILGIIMTTVALDEQLNGRVLFVVGERSQIYTKDIHKLAGLLGSPAFFAAVIGMSSGFAVYRFAQSRTSAGRLFCGIVLVYLIVGMYYTYNRAGYVSVAIVMLLAALAWPAFRRAFAAGVIVAAAGLVLSWSMVQQSTVVTQRLGARGPIEYRMEIWGRAALIFARDPLLGLGYGNFAVVYPQYNPAWNWEGVPPAPHNSVLEVAFNSGLLGAVPYVTCGILVVIGCLRFRQRARDVPGDRALVTAFAIALVPYLVQAMVVDMVAAYYVNMLMMLCVGALFGWQVENERQAANVLASIQGRQ